MWQIYYKIFCCLQFPQTLNGKYDDEDDATSGNGEESWQRWAERSFFAINMFSAESTQKFVINKSVYDKYHLLLV